jgi:hypothetical protein
MLVFQKKTPYEISKQICSVLEFWEKILFLILRWEDFNQYEIIELHVLTKMQIHWSRMEIAFFTSFQFLHSH